MKSCEIHMKCSSDFHKIRISILPWTEISCAIANIFYRELIHHAVLKPNSLLEIVGKFYEYFIPLLSYQ